jgi:hypothetical protein
MADLLTNSWADAVVAASTTLTATSRSGSAARRDGAEAARLEHCLGGTARARCGRPILRDRSTIARGAEPTARAATVE